MKICVVAIAERFRQHRRQANIADLKLKPINDRRRYRPHKDEP